MKQLHEGVHRKRPEFRPNIRILHHNNVPANKVLSIKKFLAQKLTTEIEYPTHSPDFTLNDFWLSVKVKFVLKG
jgi:hypothetical protein